MNNTKVNTLNIKNFNKIIVEYTNKKINNNSMFVDTINNTKIYNKKINKTILNNSSIDFITNKINQYKINNNNNNLTFQDIVENKQLLDKSNNQYLYQYINNCLNSSLITTTKNIIKKSIPFSSSLKLE